MDLGIVDQKVAAKELADVGLSSGLYSPHDPLKRSPDSRWHSASFRSGLHWDFSYFWRPRLL